MSRLRIGIVGCGEVTQVIHLPALKQLADEFEVTALCDVNAEVLAGVAADWGIVTQYSDYTRLLAEAPVDAVLVANPHVLHAEVANAAMEAGKDVLIEKPMCLTLSEADALSATAARTSRIVQVGYMRRYAGAFLDAVELVRPRRGEVMFARAHDFIGQNSLIVNSTSRVVRAPLPGAQALAPLELARLEEAVGRSSPELWNVFSMLHGLGSHDLSALRELFGRPQRVLYAAYRAGGQAITAALDYGHFVCEFAIGVDDIVRYETYLEVFCGSIKVRVDYETPYVRNQPARLTVVEQQKPAGIRRTESYPTRLDSFVSEWMAFADSVRTRTPPKTSIDDARADLELIIEIVRATAASAPV